MSDTLVLLDGDGKVTKLEAEDIIIVKKSGSFAILQVERDGSFLANKHGETSFRLPVAGVSGTAVSTICNLYASAAGLFTEKTSDDTEEVRYSLKSPGQPKQ